VGNYDDIVTTTTNRRNDGMFAYARGPIDFWDGWLTEDEYLTPVKKVYSWGPDAQRNDVEYQDLKKAAFKLARKVGWEGDIRPDSGPFVAGLPGDEIGMDGNIMIAWKQDNNGETFIVSPFRLQWLEDGDNWIKG